MPNSADAQADLIAILDFQTEAGVDVALDEVTRDRVVAAP